MEDVEDFYLHQTRLLDEATAKLRSLRSEASDMRESIFELELSIATLHFPDMLQEFQRNESLIREVQAQFDKHFLEMKNSDSTCKLQLEGSQSDNAQMPSRLQNNSISPNEYASQS